MWLITLRDLQWRRRRFMIATGGAALVFAITLVMSGMSASFRAEARRTIAAMGVDAWVVKAGVSGPFTTIATVTASDAAASIRAQPGVDRVDPLIIVHQSITTDQLVDVTLFGHRIGGLGEPPVSRGRNASGSGEAVVDDSLGLEPGRSFHLGGVTITVAGVSHGLTINAGSPNVYVPIGDVQSLIFEGRDTATAILTKGKPAGPIEGFKVMSNDQAREDVLRPLRKPMQAIDTTQLLLWLIAAAIIGSVVYLSALERMRDFAVLKATGGSSRGLLVGLALQAVIVSLISAAVAAGLSRFLVGLFPIQAEIPGASLALLPGIAIVVGLVSSVAGLRRAVGVDPALAFGGP